jgi:hypothetical protein
VFATALQNVFGGLLKLVLLAGGALYAGLVLMRYRSHQARRRPYLHWRDPARSIEVLAVWLGVKAVAFVARAAAPIYGMLSEASADVGEWFLTRTARNEK